MLVIICSISFPNFARIVVLNRLNELSQDFRHFSTSLFDEFLPSDYFINQNLLDSMPMINCSGKRNGKVAKDLTDKEYCSTKSFYYYAVNLHALALRRLNTCLFLRKLR